MKFFPLTKKQKIFLWAYPFAKLAIFTVLVLIVVSNGPFEWEQSVNSQIVERERSATQIFMYDTAKQITHSRWMSSFLIFFPTPDFPLSFYFYVILEGVLVLYIYKLIAKR